MVGLIGQINLKEKMRRIVPYFYSYETHARGRWVGRTLYEVFCTEFRGKPKEAYERAFSEGQIYILSKGVKMLVDRSYIVKHGDQIVHRSHRHEPNVDITGFKVVHEDSEFMVVNKPSTLPVHPVGRYHDNTLEHILKERGYGKFYIIHRLDVLTSGLIIVAKNLEFCHKAMALFKDNLIKKTYLARVKGKFSFCGVVDQKIQCVHYPMTVHAVIANGKECQTQFKLLRYDQGKDESIVECQPLTGRSHQIRVHLRWLGHPIANDPIYAKGELWLGKETLSFDQLHERAEQWMQVEANKELEDKENRCPVCNDYFKDQIKHPGIYLHAWKLKSMNDQVPISVESDVPEWAK